MHRSLFPWFSPAGRRAPPGLFDRVRASPLLPVLAVLGVFLACDANGPAPLGRAQVTITPITAQSYNLFGTVQVQGLNVPYSTGTYPGYNTHLPAGAYTYTIAVDGYTTATGTITVGANPPAQFYYFVPLFGSVDASGTVVNSATGAGVGGAELRLSRQTAQGVYTGAALQFILTTDANGAYNLDDAPTGFFTVAVTRAGFTDRTLLDVELTGAVIVLNPILLVPAP